jgi:hypothetical protein
MAKVGRRRGAMVGYVSPWAYARRAAVYKGFIRGRRGWLVVGLVLWTPRIVKRVLGRHPELVATEVLQPGQFVRLESIPPLSRRERKALKRAR